MAGKIIRVGVAVALAFVVVGCGDDERPGSLPDKPSSDAPADSPSTAPSASVEQEVLAQYKRYLAAVPAARNAPAAKRRSILEPVVAEPYLSQLVKNMADQEAAGVGIYGDAPPILNSTITAKGDAATLSVCHDESRLGRIDLRTGEKLTVGPPRNPSVIHLRRPAGDTWHIAGVAFPGGRC